MSFDPSAQYPQLVSLEEAKDLVDFNIWYPANLDGEWQVQTLVALMPFGAWFELRATRSSGASFALIEVDASAPTAMKESMRQIMGDSPITTGLSNVLQASEAPTETWCGCSVRLLQQADRTEIHFAKDSTTMLIESSLLSLDELRRLVSSLSPVN